MAISVPIAPYCRASTLRMLHTAGDTRPSAMILSNSAVPLRPLADTTPLRQVPAQGITQHRALARTSNCRARCSIKAVCCSFCLDRDEPHRWPRDGLTDRSRIVRVVLAALGGKPSHNSAGSARTVVTKPLKLAAPRCADGHASIPTRQGGSSPKYSSTFARTGPVADYNRARSIYPMHLKDRLRNIKPNLC